MPHPYPFKWEDVPQEELEKAIRKPTKDYVRSTPGNVWMPKGFQDIAEKIYNFEVREDDIWILSYPKCGSHWTQEMVWQIVHNLDFEASKEISLWARSPLLEFEAMAPAGAKATILEKASDATSHSFQMIFLNSIEFTEKLASPRIIKSHLPVSLLPPELFTKGCKIIYVCRNPKDTCVSFFHHNQLMKDDYAEDFEHFQQLFMNGTFVYGSYWNHLKTAWGHRDHPNFRILWYEDLKSDLQKVIQDTVNFLGYEMTQGKVKELAEFLHIGKQRQNAEDLAEKGEESMKALSKFFRKGVVGDWKNHITGENISLWNTWVAENLEGTDIPLRFE